MVDEDMRVWLIEANTNCCMGMPNQYMKYLVAKMTDEMLALTVDPIYPPMNNPIEDDSKLNV
jgi:hypothetical protein